MATSTIAVNSAAGGEHATIAVRAPRARAAERGGDVRRGPGRRDAHHEVAGAHAALLEVALRALRPILRAFLRPCERREPTGDDALHHLRVRTERRGALGGIEYAKAARRAGTHVEETASGTEGLLGQHDGARDLGALAGDGVGNRAVLGRNEVHDLFGRREVDVTRARIAALGETWVNVGSGHEGERGYP